MTTETRHQTAIGWTHRPDPKTGRMTDGATWNPVTGCTKVSPGCDNCYAEALTQRWKWNGGKFDEIVLHPDRLKQPYSWRDDRTVFVGSMTDLFHPDVPFAFVQQIFRVMAETPKHTYLLLTKRPKTMAYYWESYLRRGTPYLTQWPANTWAGTTVESQEYVSRIDALARVPAPVRFVSAEPLLGPLDLTVNARRSKIDWVITGGESGPHFRPFNPTWAEQIRAQVSLPELGVAFFHKQNGGRTPKANGEDLFGQIYNEFPIPRDTLE